MPLPAFLSDEDLRQLRHRLAVQKSIAGTRVRLSDARGEAEYVRLTTNAWQRLEGGDVPKFPATLAARDLVSNAMPYVVTSSPGRVELRAASGHALYGPLGDGWRKLWES